MASGALQLVDGVAHRRRKNTSSMVIRFPALSIFCVSRLLNNPTADIYPIGT